MAAISSLLGQMSLRYTGCPSSVPVPSGAVVMSSFMVPSSE